MNWRIIEQAYHKAFQVYYCHPRSPWKKGSNENMNGRIRAYLPRSTFIEKVKKAQLDKICNILNNTPRKILGYKTPKELFLKEF